MKLLRAQVQFWLFSNDINAIDLLGDILLDYKRLNTRDSLLFICSVYQIKIVMKSNENLFSLPDFFQNRISNLVLNFCLVHERIDKKCKMNTRLIRASRMSSKKVYYSRLGRLPIRRITQINSEKNNKESPCIMPVQYTRGICSILGDVQCTRGYSVHWEDIIE